MCIGKIQDVNSVAFKNFGKDINQELLKLRYDIEAVLSTGSEKAFFN